MSTELAKLKGGELSADIIAKLQKHTEQERERIGKSGGGDGITISNSKIFSMPNEQEVAEFEGLIVDFAYRNEYYLGPYNPKAITPPACFAIAPSVSQLIPSSNAPIPQNATDCATCQQNQFGSAPMGDGKACKNTVIIAVLPPDASLVDTHDLWILKTSPTAIRPFNKYASQISGMNIPLGAVRTKFFFDPDSKHASVRFEALGVEADCIDGVIARKDEAAKRLSEEPDVSQFEMPTAGKAKGK
jgi:hypothetical protein